jgi:hypothetical protein
MNMKTKTQICQSCGLPMDFTNSGTNLDLSKNNEYCIHCFSEGDFVIPNLTLEQQVQRLTDMGVEKMGMTDSDARKQAKSTLPKLKRWQ